MLRQTRQDEHPYSFMREGQEHSRNASLHDFYLVSKYGIYETLGRIETYWHDSVSLSEDNLHTYHEGTVRRNRHEGRRIPRGEVDSQPFRKASQEDSPAD